MENHAKTNLDSCDPLHRSGVENNIAGLIILLISFISMTGNGLVLISFANCNQLRQQKGSYFIANLALCDLLTSVYVMFPSALCLFDTKIRLEGLICRIHGLFNCAFITSSNLSLAAINLDRAIAVSRPFDYRNLVTMCRVKIVVVYIWIQGLCLGFVATISDTNSFRYWELMCSPDWSRENAAYSWIAALLSFGLPSLLVLVSNVAIIYAIRKSRSVVFQTCVAADGTGNGLCVKTNTRTLRSLYLLVFVYFTCVCPYYLTKAGLLLRSGRMDSPWICLLPPFLLYLAAAINPLVYAILRRDHRKAFLETVGMIARKLKSVQEFLFSNPLKPLN